LFFFFLGAGNQNRTPLQSSDSRKKISFRWNSRTFPSGSLVVTSKSVEQQLMESANSGKLVPYEDDVSDDSETENEPAETIEVMRVTKDEKTNVDDAGCANSCDNTYSLAAVSLVNGKSDDMVNTSIDCNTEQLLKPAEPIVTSVPGCIERLPSAVVNNSDTSVLSSNSVTVPEVESVGVDKEVGTTEDCLAVLADGDTCSSAKVAADDSSAYQLQNGHLSSDSNAVRNAVSGRKRHSSHKSRRHHMKHRRRHTSTSAWYSSDEEMEYVWVEKTAETIAQQLTGK